MVLKKSVCLFSNNLNQIDIERCGRAYFLYNRYRNFGTSLDEFSDDNSIDGVNSKISDVDINFLRGLNPKTCKDQDHYAVLGLKSRFFASEDDIRQAFRKMVLKHHPDKRKAIGEEINQETDYFTCITKAYEILGNFKSRRSYDSVDPEFCDSLPATTEIEKDFFITFDKCFSLNSRWSEKKNCPSIGHTDSSREEVEHFYSFWYEFNSWREYSYLDEEDKEKGQDREERRWIEKQNKVARIKRKKEEMARIRSLVDLAYNNDPRIIKFKNEEKERKNAAKKAKMNAAQAAKIEQEKILKEAQLAKEAFEKAEQKRIEQARQEKEQLKKSLKKEKKLLRDKLKENEFFSLTMEEKIKNMEGLEKICEIMKLNELQELNRQLEQNNNKESFFIALKNIENKLEEERSAHLTYNLNNINDTNNINNVTVNGKDKITNKEDSFWNKDMVQLLIKAVNLFPAGTNQRWEVIATFMNQHSENLKILKARDVLSKAKDLQSGDFSKNLIKSELNETAYESFEKHVKKVGKVKIDDIKSDQNQIDHNDNNLLNGNSSNSNNKKLQQQYINENWTKEEQALLEQAIKTYPISTADRWDRIAECVPNRSKKECLKRVKTLVDRINAKKEVQQSIK